MQVLQVKLSGWSATPRMPYILSGNAVCMNNPSYATILGIIGCCMGQNVIPSHFSLGYKYSFDTVSKDLETRHRLEYDGKKLKPNAKGTDAYEREFHVNPLLTIWLSDITFKQYFDNPIGTPCLGQSQDLLHIVDVSIIEVENIPNGYLSGTMIPFNAANNIAGQLVQLVDYFIENEEVGKGRTPKSSSMYLSIHHENEQDIALDNLYRIKGTETCFYLKNFNE
jgi:CRISPR-associated protein Cas5t